jgi:hypothetical protein
MRLALILASLLAGGSALAQGEDDRGPLAENTPEARQAIEAYGKCTAEREPGEANRLLTMDFSSSRYRSGLRLLAEEAARSCARDIVGPGNLMRSANLLFSGALAEALLEADATPLNARLARSAAVEAPSYSPTDAVAQCLARSLPDQVAALFATAPGSDAETAAAAPLAQAVPACARAAGIRAQLDLSVPALRAMIATAAYRLVGVDGESDA